MSLGENEVPTINDEKLRIVRALEEEVLACPGVNFVGSYFRDGVLTLVVGGERLSVLRAMVPAWVQATLGLKCNLQLVRGRTKAP